MKKIIFPFFFLNVSSAFAQTVITDNAYRCPCNQIGLDSAWAVEEKLDCYKIPVQNASASASVFMAVVVANNYQAKTEPLLYLHGGPGIATLGNLPKYLKRDTWKKLRGQHSLVFFDYRGTGFSEPHLEGYHDSLQAFKYKGHNSKEIHDYEVSLVKKFRKKLLEKGEDLKFSSYQNAADAESIRKALYIKKWNVYGVSHGTTVALHYLKHYEASVNTMMLDSPFPPNAPWMDFVRPFNECFVQMEKHIASQNVYTENFSGLRNSFAVAVKKLNNSPVQIHPPGTPDSLKIPFNGDDFAWAVWQAMLSPKTIPVVPVIIKEVKKGNNEVIEIFVALFGNADKFGKLSPLQSHSVFCFEGKPRTPGDNDEKLARQFPEFASFKNPGSADDICKACRTDSVANDYFLPVHSNKPVLIVAGEYDPVCPPIFLRYASQKLSNAVKVVVPGGSHAALGMNDCVLNMALNFLANRYNPEDLNCVMKLPAPRFITENITEEMKKLK